MRELLLLRHGPTAWNRRRLIQGRRDVALDPATKRALARCRVPTPWSEGEWHASPLARARDSARALGAVGLVTDERLQEMDWGRWEGCTLAELRQRHGEAMRRNESLGMDFRPSGGESPREVCQRLAGWLAQLASGSGPVVAVTHKGVIRAALSLATGWDMREAFPTRLDWSCGQAFVVAPDGILSLQRFDVMLERAE